MSEILKKGEFAIISDSRVCEVVDIVEVNGQEYVICCDYGETTTSAITAFARDYIVCKEVVEDGKLFIELVEDKAVLQQLNETLNILKNIDCN